MTAQGQHPTAVRRSWSDVGQCARYLEQKRRDYGTERSREERKSPCLPMYFLLPRKVCLKKSFAVCTRKGQSEATDDDNPGQTSGHANPFVGIRCPGY